MRSRCVFAVSLAAVLASSLSVSASAAPTGTPGSASADDPYFPWQGNGGYDVGSYSLHVGYTPSTKELTGYARIDAEATMSLSRFDLDLRRNLVVSSVQVNGEPAAFAQPRAQVQELVITPAHVLPEGESFTVQVRYAGTAKYVLDPDGALDGFIPTADGAFVASEPQGSPTWFPVNDTPRDKATYRVAVTVPEGLTALSNGELTGVRHGAERTTWSWHLDRPVSSYLITATLGKFDLSFGHTRAGIPYVTAYDPAEEAAARPVVSKLPAIVDYFSRVYGEYPFGQTGAIIDHAPEVGYELETATRPVFDQAPDAVLLAHELAHQWYGDEVTLSRWRDIWVNEGFAEFSSWLWDEHSGGTTAAAHLDEILARPASDDDTWRPPPGNPGAADEIFAGSVYDRGAATLQALREKLGNDTFFRIMRGWLQAKRYDNATVGQFTTYAAQVAHTDLSHFFDVWLYKPAKPGT